MIFFLISKWIHVCHRNSGNCRKAHTKNHPLPSIQKFLFFLPLLLKLSLICLKKAGRTYIRANGHRPIKPETRSFHGRFLKFKNSKLHSSLIYGSEEIKWLDCQGFKARMTWICCRQEKGSQDFGEGDSGSCHWKAKPCLASTWAWNVGVCLCYCVCLCRLWLVYVAGVCVVVVCVWGWVTLVERVWQLPRGPTREMEMSAQLSVFFWRSEKLWVWELPPVMFCLRSKVQSFSKKCILCQRILK